jgi:RNA polymerase sigma-70 factor (ECF subfamily)
LSAKETMTFEFVIPKVGVADAGAPVELLMNDEEFAAFYERTARPIWAYLARVSRNPALADDLLQESYLRFLGVTTTMPEGEVARRSYLFRIASNLLRDHWRRPKQVALDDVPEAALSVVGRESARVESEMLLDQAFQFMSARERQLLWLAYAEGMAHRQIAETTGLAVTSIRILLFRAKRKLARSLQPESVKK